MFILTVKYTLFAVISTIGNLLTQHLILILLETFGINKILAALKFLEILRGKSGLLIAIFFGTLVGLIIKYILDKKFIFNFKTKSKSENAEKFLLYSFMGIFTTLIYWAFELCFDFFLGSESAKYIGAAIGLAIGYVIKYNLDKRFVFKYNTQEH